jgi:hypothetical protein
MYVKCRHPRPALAFYQFSQPLKTAVTDDFTITSPSTATARTSARAELGPETLEGNIILTTHANTIYGMNPQIVALYYTRARRRGRGCRAHGRQPQGLREIRVCGGNQRIQALVRGRARPDGFTPARPATTARAPLQASGDGQVLLSYAQTALLLGDGSLADGRQIAAASAWATSEA